MPHASTRGLLLGRPSVSAEPPAARMPLLIVWLSPIGYCCRERQNAVFVLEYTSSRVWFPYKCIAITSKYKIKNVSCETEDFIETHLCKLRGILRSCVKQNKDAVSSLVLLLVTGVRADPKYSYSYDIICMYVRIVTFDFSVKYYFMKS